MRLGVGNVDSVPWSPLPDGYRQRGTARGAIPTFGGKQLLNGNPFPYILWVMKTIYAREDVCIGCRLCMIHCLVKHSRTKRIIKAFKEEPRALARVLVEESGPVSFAMQCRHCVEPACVEACMTGAMSRDVQTGMVQHDPEKCVGCWMCIMVCEAGAIRRDEARGKIASKCDLCPDEEVPVCVANCPNEALVLVTKDESVHGDR